MRIAAGGVETPSAVVPRRRKRVLVAAAVWLSIAAAAWWWAGEHPDGAAGAITDLLSVAETPRGALGVLLVAFALRPVTLLPPTVLTAFAGFLLGPWLGFVVATLAVVSTSLVPYGAARLLRGRSLRPPRSGWRSALARRPFAAVLSARLAMLPGDLVNVSAGVLRVPLWPFVAATVLGGSPGMLVGVLAGASLRGSRFSADALTLDLRLLVGALVVLLVSVAVAALLRRREVVA
jgi:uncharacterized membrane protein YdjX (TVP38/TMEM64 family)